MRRLILMLISGASVGLIGCWTNAPPGEPGPPPVEWSEDMQAVADGNNRFALELYARLREEKGNVFFSPYSAAHRPGDDHRRREGGHPRPDGECAAPPRRRAEGRRGGRPRPVLRPPAGGLPAVGRHRPLGPEGVPVAARVPGPPADPVRRRLPGGGLRRRPRGREEADQRLGSGADPRPDQGQLIREGLITRQHRMVLANAVYFKGAWKDQFDPKRTRPLDFTQADGTKTQVPMMHREGKFRMYVETRPDGRFEPEFQVAELPYKGGELSMVVLLPGKRDGLPALEAKLTPDDLAGWLTKARDAGDADILLPKFRIEADSMMLKEPLQKLGMLAAFDQGKANFTGLHAGGEQLFLDFVVQKAFVDVNEEGTEAAAATGVGVRLTSARLGFQATHPFVFLIRDTRHGTILFMGRVEKP